jgi:hypothetical protein
MVSELYYMLFAIFGSFALVSVGKKIGLMLAHRNIKRSDKGDYKYKNNDAVQMSGSTGEKKQSSANSIFKKYNLYIEDHMTVEAGNNKQAGIGQFARNNQMPTFQKVIRSFEVKTKGLPDILELQAYTKIGSKNTHNVDKDLENGLKNYVLSILRDFKQAGITTVDEGILLPSDAPGNYKIAMQTQATKKQASYRSKLKAAKLYSTAAIGTSTIDVYPEVEERPDGDLIIDPLRSDINFTKMEIALPILSKEFDKNFTEVKEEGGVYRVVVEREVPSIYEKGDMLKNYDKWNDEIVKKMRDEDSEHWYLGEVIDPKIKLKLSQVIWPIKTCPHMMVAGATRSGKSKTLAGVITDLVAAYPDSTWYFGDGKGAADLIPFAKKLSSLPVAMPNTGSDPTIEFANVVLEVWREYLRRQKISSEASALGYDCSTFLELRDVAKKLNKPEWHFGRVFLVIDEFAAVQTLMMDSKKLLNAEGSILFYIKRMLAEAASYGVTIILASQRVQADSFPSAIRSNLTIRLLHIMNQQDSNFLDNPCSVPADGYRFWG